MAQWPPFPLASIDGSNQAVWPVRVEVGPLTRIGPTAENRQYAVIEQRTEALREMVNFAAASLSQVRDNFLDRDGADPAVILESGEPSDQGPVWMRGDMDMGGFKITKLAVATNANDLATQDQLEEIQFQAEDEVEQIVDALLFKVDGTAVATAPLNAGTQRVLNVADPVLAAHATRKAVFDAAASAVQSTLVLRSGGTLMTGDLSLDGPTPSDPGFSVVNLGDPVGGSDLVNLRYLNDRIDEIGVEDVPTGAIIPFAGPVNKVPSNFLVCDGRELSRVVYQSLFNVIGIAYGSPSSSSVFKLPDLRGRVVVGRDNMGGQPANRIASSWAALLGGVGGTETHALTIPQIPSHTHDYDDRVFAEGAGGALAGADDGTNTDSVHGSTAGTTGTSGAGIPHNNLQPSMAQLYVIRI